MGDEERPASPLAIALFGLFDMRLHGCPLPRLHSQKTQWLLALLALQAGRAVERAWLARILWPESAEPRAAFNLRRNLWYLRQSLGPEAGRLEAPTTGTLRLNMVGAEADLLLFDEAICRGDAPSLERAVALHRGPLLQGCGEEWILPERAAREEAYLQALETLAAHASARGEHGAAVRTLRRVAVADPLRDSAQRALMQALAATGDLAAATQVYRDFRLLLHRELNAAPDPETLDTFQQIQAEVRERAALGARRSVPGPTIAGPIPPRQAPSTGHRALSSPEHRAPSTEHGSAATHLPRPLTRLVGRGEEVGEVRARLAAERLVTLTGPGGVGKTRLAIQVAETVTAGYCHGAWFVDLGALADPALVPQTVATVLGVREAGDSPLLATLQKVLAPRQLLLVLDNCEHLLAACASLAEALLSAAPHLRILATSRQPLGLTGEIVWRVPSLSLPPCSDPGGWLQAPSARLQARQQPVPSPPGAWSLEPGTDVLDLLQFDAVRLFVERAQAAVPGFELTEQNAPATVHLCRRLDGIPLAIELAAARLKVLPVEQITARLDDRFRLLTGASRTAPARHQTLQAALDWSYELLAEPERELLRRLSVFAGGFTLEAAEWVAAFPAVGGGRPSAYAHPGVGSQSAASRWAADDTLDLLTQLIDQSLVYVERTGSEARYRLLETTRAYAQERLRESGEGEAVRGRHRDWFLQLAEQAEPELEGAHQQEWLERLDAEQDNLRAALAWGCTSEPETALRLAGALGRFLYMRGHFHEGRIWLERALSQTAGEATAARAKALHAAGVLWHEQGQYATARGLEEESLAIWRQLGDRHAIAASLDQLGHIVNAQGDDERATALFEESLALRREIRDRAGAAASLNALGYMAMFHGDYERAAALCGESLRLRRELEDRWGIAYSLEFLVQLAIDRGDGEPAAGPLHECLALRRQLGDRRGIAAALLNLGRVANDQGDWAAALTRCEESLHIWQELGSPDGIAGCLETMARAAHGQGDQERAAALYQQGLALWQEIAQRLGIVNCLEGLARVACSRGEPRRATRWLAAAARAREALGTPLPALLRATTEQSTAAARAALGEEAWAIAWADGRALSLEQAIEEALAQTESA